MAYRRNVVSDRARDPLVVLALGSGLYVLLGGPVDLSALPFPGIYLFVVAWKPSGAAVRKNSAGAGSLFPFLQERYSALVTWIIGDSIREWAGQLLRWNVSIKYWVLDKPLRLGVKY